MAKKVTRTNAQGKKVTHTIDPKRSKAAKKGAAKRRGKPLSTAHKLAISKALKKSKAAKAARKTRKK